MIIILVIVLTVFGPKRLPEIGRTVGKGLREFRQASMGIREELTRGLNDEPEWSPNPEMASHDGASSTGTAGDGKAGLQARDGGSGASGDDRTQ